MDNLFARLRRDDLLDKLVHYQKLPVRELAELLGIAPQLVYYRIRNHKLDKVQCEHCGTEGFIGLEQARQAFPALQEAIEAQEETQGGTLETEETT